MNHGLSDLSTSTGSLAPAKCYGGILNPGVRRRDRRGFNPAPDNNSNTTKTQISSQKPTPAKPSVGTQLKNKSSDSPSSSQSLSNPSAGMAGTSGTKVRSGGIMQSFAKAAASKKDLKPKPAPPTQSSEMGASSAAIACDDDDREEDGPSGFLPKPRAPGNSAASRKAREDREAELKRMMEEGDENEVEEVPSPPGKVLEEPSPGLEEAEINPEEDTQSQGQGDSLGGEVVSSYGNGRRRGKRKVIKKRQVQDDEGYFGKSLQVCLFENGIHTAANHPFSGFSPVTVRDTAWESFSEDEAPPPNKATPPPAPSSGGAAKTKRPAPKGQGSIMSFFGKKT